MNSPWQFRPLLLVAMIAFTSTAVVCKGNETNDIRRLEACVLPFTDAARRSNGILPLCYPQFDKRLKKYVKGKEPGTMSAESGEIRLGKGTDQHNYLDCTCFASPVIHSFKTPSFSTFDNKIQQGWGDEIATNYHLSLVLSTNISSFLVTARTNGLELGAFFFDLRNEKGQSKTKPEEGGQGHVGFLIVRKGVGLEGITQIHMSGMTNITSRADGGLVYDQRFEYFLKNSGYGKSARIQKTSTITLYRLTRPDPPQNLRIIW